MQHATQLQHWLDIYLWINMKIYGQAGVVVDWGMLNMPMLIFHLAWINRTIIKFLPNTFKINDYVLVSNKMSIVDHHIMTKITTTTTTSQQIVIWNAWVNFSLGRDEYGFCFNIFCEQIASQSACLFFV